MHVENLPLIARGLGGKNIEQIKLIFRTILVSSVLPTGEIQV